jgi:hypothetical protein
MNYSTLQEAYNINTFEKKKPTQKSNKNIGSMMAPLNSSPSFIETSKLALNSNKLSDYPVDGSSCSPLQAPNYNIPVSNECKKEFDNVMNVYTNTNNNNNMMYKAQNNMNAPNNGVAIASTIADTSTILQGSPLSSTTSSSLNYSTNMFNNLKSSNNNVMPYYDEDLEQYFNINNINDEVKYKSNAYMPNYNQQPYTNNDTSEYTNNNVIPKNGNNLLNNSSYNLTPEEKKSADEAIAFLKTIEDKITNGNINSSGYNKSSIVDPVLPTNNTGPGGFKIPNSNSQEKSEKVIDKVNNVEKVNNIEKVNNVEKVVEKVVEKDDNNSIYKTIFNISILLLIGIAIILLCDQIVELSIQIGMKRVVNILEPFLKNQIQIPVQELVANSQ